MPTLNEYDVDNEKDGHFIRANVGGNHPITLQVTVVASRIFKALNYADGDAVPTELVWSMYDLNMVYTLSSVDVEKETNDIDPADVLEKLDLNNQLTEDERAELISYLKAYEGPDADKIQQLKEELLANTSAAALEEGNMSGGAWFPSFNQLPETKQEVIDLFRKWCDDAMFERAQKAVLVHEKFVIWSVRTFAAHDNLHENPIDAIEDKEIVYRLTPPEGNKMVIVADCRGHNRSLSRENAPDVEYDYRIKRTLSDGTHETAHIQEDIIVDYEATPTEDGSSTLFKYDLDAMLPPNQSYFGGTDDKSYRARFLRDEVLSKSIDSIKQDIEDNKYTYQIDPKTSDDNVGNGTYAENRYIGSDPPKDGIPDEIIRAVNKTPRAKFLTVEGISNNSNIKTTVGEDLLVITAEINAETGDQIIVRVPDYIEDNTVVKAAATIDEVPTDTAEEWLESNLW